VEVPSSYVDMESCGFVPRYANQRDSAVDSPADTTIQMGWKTSDNGSFRVGYTINDGKVVLPVHECTTKTFIIHPLNDTYPYIPEVGEAEVVFYGGITVNSTEAKVASILEKQSSDHQKTVYKTCFDKSERSYLRVEFREGKISMIEIWNNVAESNEKYRY